jgi:hypothetical protein
MSLPQAPGVGSGPVDPDPPPKPNALLSALRAGAVVVDDHLQIDGLDRWLCVDREMGWLVVDAPVVEQVRIDLSALTLLRRVEPIPGTPFVTLRGKRYSVRPVLLDGPAGVCAHVGLVLVS